jgi:hypothetical protein
LMIWLRRKGPLLHAGPDQQFQPVKTQGTPTPVDGEVAREYFVWWPVRNHARYLYTLHYIGYVARCVTWITHVLGPSSCDDVGEIKGARMHLCTDRSDSSRVKNKSIKFSHNYLRYRKIGHIYIYIYINYHAMYVCFLKICIQ